MAFNFYFIRLETEAHQMEEKKVVKIIFGYLA